MLETFSIRSLSGDYEVHIGSRFLVDGLQNQSAKSFNLIDENVDHLWPNVCGPSALKIDALEQNKTLNQVAILIESLRSLGANKSSNLFAIGGGIIQDLATFVASTYMRGISWTYCPTTLLGMVDSCVGGKSSLNVGIYKNIAGNFFPPRKILIDTAFCNTLSEQDKISGLCEAIKINFASSPSNLEKFLSIFNGDIENFTEDDALKIVSLSLHAKKEFIEGDEFDQGIRLLLNFGHTFGHSIEAATQFSITHGIAVGLGMLAEIELSSMLGIDVEKIPRISKLKTFIHNLFKNLPELTFQLRSLCVADAIASFRSDKKHTDKKYFLILVNSQGELVRHGLDKHQELEMMIQSIFIKIKEGSLF